MIVYLSSQELTSAQYFTYDQVVIKRCVRSYTVDKVEYIRNIQLQLWAMIVP